MGDENQMLYGGTQIVVESGGPTLVFAGPSFHLDDGPRIINNIPSTQLPTPYKPHPQKD
jgi:hypothetical protein